MDMIKLCGTEFPKALSYLKKYFLTISVEN